MASQEVEKPLKIREPYYLRIQALFDSLDSNPDNPDQREMKAPDYQISALEPVRINKIASEKQDAFLVRFGGSASYYLSRFGGIEYYSIPDIFLKESCSEIPNPSPISVPENIRNSVSNKLIEYTEKFIKDGPQLFPFQPAFFE